MIQTLYMFTLLPVPGYAGSTVTPSHITIALPQRTSTDGRITEVILGSDSKADLVVPDTDAYSCVLQMDESGEVTIRRFERAMSLDPRVNETRFWQRGLFIGDTIQYTSCTIQYTGMMKSMVEGDPLPKVRIVSMASGPPVTPYAPAHPAKTKKRTHTRAFLSLPSVAFGAAGPSSTLTPFQINLLLRLAVRYGELPRPEKKHARLDLWAFLAGLGQSPSMHLPKDEES